MHTLTDEMKNTLLNSFSTSDFCKCNLQSFVLRGILCYVLLPWRQQHFCVLARDHNNAVNDDDDDDDDDNDDDGDDDVDDDDDDDEQFLIEIQSWIPYHKNITYFPYTSPASRLELRVW